MVAETISETITDRAAVKTTAIKAAGW